MKMMNARYGSVLMLICLTILMGACNNAEKEAKAKEAAAAVVADSLAKVEDQRTMQALSKEADELDSEMDALENEVNALLKDI